MKAIRDIIFSGEIMKQLILIVLSLCLIGLVVCLPSIVINREICISHCTQSMRACIAPLDDKDEEFDAKYDNCEERKGTCFDGCSMGEL